MKSVFPYPGGKSQYANWIIDEFPDHDCYVEVFGGGAGVLVNKEPSHIEVYNDIDGDLVHFFETLRDRTDELVKWLQRTPYSRELHERYATEYYNGHREDDDVTRAGKFFYLRYTQWGGHIANKDIYKITRSPKVGSSEASKYERKVDLLDGFADRFRGVNIEQMDWRELVDKYDREETLFYLDPPYVDVGDDYYTHEGEFNHSEFVETLRSLDGKWIVSYTDLPPGLENYHVLTRNQRVGLKHQEDGECQQTNTERLVMNFDPVEEPDFAGPDQSNLDSFAGADD